MTGKNAQRTVVRLLKADLRPFDRYGQVEPGQHWLPLNYEAESGSGNFLLRLDPGAQTRLHVHGDLEELLVLEGTLIENDGEAFGPGEFISYAPGSTHFSRSETGCLFMVQVRKFAKYVDEWTAKATKGN